MDRYGIICLDVRIASEYNVKASEADNEAITVAATRAQSSIAFDV